MSEEQAPPLEGETAGKKPFPVKKYLINLKGKEYLPVAARVAWFRHDCAIDEGYGIQTEQVAGSRAEGFATFRAMVFYNGECIGMGHKTEDKAGFADFDEKAETGAIGRALALCGFGTLFATELDEGDRLADSPQGNNQPPSARSQPAAAAGPQACTFEGCGKTVTPARASFCKSKSIPVSCPDHKV